MDYMYANIMGNGFERTKTLGDGDDCCNCRYFMKGDCEWSPQKGLVWENQGAMFAEQTNSVQFKINIMRRNDNKMLQIKIRCDIINS